MVIKPKPAKLLHSKDCNQVVVDAQSQIIIRLYKMRKKNDCKKDAKLKSTVVIGVGNLNQFYFQQSQINSYSES